MPLHVPSSSRTPKAASPALAKGQLWKTERGFVAIDHVGKRLIDYRLMKVPAQRAVRSQMATPDNVAEFLQANAGQLIKGAR